MLNLGFGKKLQGVYSVFNSVNYQSTLSNLVSLASPPKLYRYLALFIKYRRFGLILWSFFEGGAYLHSRVQISSSTFIF